MSLKVTYVTKVNLITKALQIPRQAYGEPTSSQVLFHRSNFRVSWSMSDPVWEEWLRNDVLSTFCPGYSPDDPTVVDDKAPPPEERTEFQPRLARIQAGKLPNGEGVSARIDLEQQRFPFGSKPGLASGLTS